MVLFLAIGERETPTRKTDFEAIECSGPDRFNEAERLAVGRLGSV